MKAQTKMIAASLVVNMLALSAVGGITYSWFSDTEDADIEISTAKVQMDTAFRYSIDDGVNYTTITDKGSGVADLSLSGFKPGDIYKFEVTYSGNESNITTYHRLYAEISGPVTKDMSDNIEFDGNNLPQLESGKTAKIVLSGWKELSAKTDQVDGGLPSDNPVVYSLKASTSWSTQPENGFAIKLVSELYQEGAPRETIVSIPAPADGSDSATVTTETSAGASDVMISVDIPVSYFVDDSKPTTFSASVEKTTENTISVDFNMIDQDGDAITNFTSDPLPVTIVVDGDYTGYTIIYDGDGTNPENVIVIYNPTEDKTTFTFDAKHFSKYVITNGTVTSASLLQNIISNGSINEITFANDIEGDVTVVEKKDMKITINGNGKTFTGSITIDGRSYQENAVVNIKNIHFDNNQIKAAAYIMLGDGDDLTRYVDDVTVQNCTFSYDGDRNDVVAVKSFTGGDLKLKLVGCTVNKGMHSAIQVNNIEQDLVVEDCKVYTIEGINLNNTPKATIKNCEFEVDDYAVRFGETESGTIKNAEFYIEGCGMKSDCAGKEKAVIVLRGNFVDSILNINTTDMDGSTLIKGNESATVIISVSTANELIDALERGNDVIFENDITIDNELLSSNAYGKTGINVTKGQTIDGGGYTLSANGAWDTWDSAINTTGGVIKNIKVTGTMRGIFINHNGESDKVVLENVTIDGTIYTISCDQGTNSDLEAINSKFYGWTSYAATLGYAKFVDCTFGYGSGYNFSRPYAPTEYVNCTFEEDHKMDPRAAVTFENCKIGGVALTADNLATLVTSNIDNASVKL